MVWVPLVWEPLAWVMSTASKVTLVATVVGTLGIVWSVHKDQVDDRAKLHEGIIRDEERQAKKRENREALIAQQRLEDRIRRSEKSEETSSVQE